MSLTEKFLKRFEGHPVVQEIEADLASETAAARVTLAAARDAAIRNRDREMPALNEVPARLKIASDKAWKDWLDLENQRGRALQARFGRGHYHEKQIHNLEVELVSTADPAIAAFIVDTYDQAEAVRNVSPASVAERDHVIAQLTAIAAARAMAQSLQLEAGDIDLAARLDAIRATIPGPFAGELVPVAA